MPEQEGHQPKWGVPFGSPALWLSSAVAFLLTLTQISGGSMPMCFISGNRVF